MPHHFPRQDKAGLFAKKGNKHEVGNLTALSIRVLTHWSAVPWLMNSLHLSICPQIHFQNLETQQKTNLTERLGFPQFPSSSGKETQQSLTKCWLGKGPGPWVLGREAFILALSISHLFGLNKNKKPSHFLERSLFCLWARVTSVSHVLWTLALANGFMKDLQQSIAGSLYKIHKLRVHLKLSASLK